MGLKEDVLRAQGKANDFFSLKAAWRRRLSVYNLYYLFFPWRCDEEGFCTGFNSFLHQAQSTGWRLYSLWGLRKQNALQSGIELVDFYLEVEAYGDF